MSNMIYFNMRAYHKPLVWLSETLTTPPLTVAARIEAGYLLRLLQSGEKLSLPHSRPMPTMERTCHELRIVDEKLNWRVFYRIDDDAIVIPHWTAKKTQATTKKDIDLARTRLKHYDSVGNNP